MKKGFTLIELLAVIVILAIIALIATPIVLDIITDTKISAKERSIENIEHAAELYITSEYQMNNKQAPSEITIGELKSSGYISNTDEDDNNKVFVYTNGIDYEFYYEERDNLGNYKTLKGLIESDTKHIKKNVVVNGNTVNKVYGTKDEQLAMNNYVLYSGQLWEVVETNDTNHTIKLVSPVSLTSIAYGLTNDWNSSWVRKWLNEYFYSKLERTDIIKETEFCIDNVDVTPDSYTKMTTCTNKVEEKVGLLTYEDYIYAFDATNSQSSNSFIYDSDNFLLITPFDSSIWCVSNYIDIKIGAISNTFGYGIRPVISIRDNVLVKSGKGTRDNPYILSSERSLKKNTKLNLGKVGDYIYLDESNNPYVTEIDETYVKGISNKTSTSKVRYRIVSINSDGSIKVERADVLKKLPNTVATSYGISMPFYSIDTGEGSTSCLYSSDKKYGEDNIEDNNYIGGCAEHNIYNPDDGFGEFKLNEGKSIGYYLNNATNSFYNWYSDKTKNMIIPTIFNLEINYYDAINDKKNVTASVGLPSLGEMYTGNDLGYSLWYINPNLNKVFRLGSDGLLGFNFVSETYHSIRPVITLSSNIYITEGDGTANNPYSLNI